MRTSPNYRTPPDDGQSVLYIRIPNRLATALQDIAEDEGERQSVVVRRLLRAAVEQRTKNLEVR